MNRRAGVDGEASTLTTTNSDTVSIRPPQKPSLVLTLGPGSTRPWWGQEFAVDQSVCALEYARVTVRSKRSKEISLLDLPLLFLKVLRVLWRARSRYEHIFTIENDFNSFAVCFWQTLFFQRRPRHVIATFIMREKTRKISSRAKYLLMRVLYKSLHRAVCSARPEAAYYADAFRWPVSKATFVPLFTSPGLLDWPVADEKGFIFAGGRVYRDYATLFQALATLSYRTIVVGEGAIPGFPSSPRFELLTQIPIDKFLTLLAESRVVVLPLEDKAFSVGQTVLLEAMALGKAVIATRTAGTVDYISQMENGLLVSPNDPRELADAIELVMTNEDLRLKLGNAARRTVRERHLPIHYARRVQAALRRTS